MLIILPSTPATQKASEYLTAEQLEHRLINVPHDLNYKTGSDLAIYTTAPNSVEYATILTRQRFVVMRVFKDYLLPEDQP
jgi:hypothetical protein